MFWKTKANVKICLKLFFHFISSLKTLAITTQLTVNFAVRVLDVTDFDLSNTIENFDSKLV